MSDYLEQLIVTPKMVAKNVRKMNDNKSPGVYRIPSKLLLEICRTNKHSARNSVKFVIRGGNSSGRMERIILNIHQ